MARRRYETLREIGQFVWRERLWWMLPVLLALGLVGGLTLLGSNPATAPFVYTLF